MLVNVFGQQIGAFARQGGDFKHRAFPFKALDKILHPRGAFALGDHVDLVQHQPARLAEQLGIVFFQLTDNGFGLLHGVHPLIKRGQINNVQQQARALQMAQKLVAQTGPFRGPLDQAGDVGHHKTLLRRNAHHAQIGVQRGERVVGNLGAGVGNRRDKGGFARIGHAQQAHIGQHFEL